MHPYTVFQRTLEDLAALVDGSADEYGLIQASGLLRRLLTDEKPLLVTANRETRLRLQFSIVPTRELPVPPSVRWRNPAFTSEFSTSRQVKLQDFLAHEVIQIEGHWYTVADVIRLGAHVMGGVHVGTPRNDREAQLLALDEHMRVLNAGAVCRCIEGIGRATVEALSPLAEALRARGS